MNFILHFPLIKKKKKYVPETRGFVDFLLKYTLFLWIHLLDSLSCSIILNSTKKVYQPVHLGGLMRRKHTGLYGSFPL